MKNSYKNIPSSIWLLSLATLISRSGTMVIVFLPLYLIQQLHFDVVTAGQIVSLDGLGEIIGSYAGGIIVDKLGSIRVQVISLFLLGVLYMSLELLDSKASIMVVMFCAGMCFAAIRPAVGSMIAKMCTPAQRPTAFSLNYQALNLGATIGPTLGGILAGINYVWLFRLDGLANIIAAIAVWFLLKPRLNQSTFHEENMLDSKQMTSAWKDKSFLFFLSMMLLIGMCFFQILNIYPIFLRSDYHLSEFEIGLILGSNGLLIILLQMPFTALLRNFSTLRVLTLGSFLISFGYFILPWHQGFYFAIFSMAIITLGEMATMPFAFNFVSDIAPPKLHGQYLGLMGCALTSVPLLLTPNLMPYIYSSFGSNVLWYVTGCIGIITMIGLTRLNTSSSRKKLLA